MMKKTNKGIYIHIPFCDKKCYYCDFTTLIKKGGAYGEYIDLLLKEIDLYKDPNINVNSIYIGGGTPSLIPAIYVDKLMNKIYHSFHVSKNSEITIEANPKTLSMEKLKSYRHHGINRVSLGVQSADNHLIHQVGRNYIREDILKDISLIRDAGFENLSIDMIFGLPGQTLHHIEEDLSFIYETDLEHISWYNLILEEKTVFGHLYNKKNLNLPNEEVEEEMYYRIVDGLAEMGFDQYELSNFAKTGKESIHNLKYWNLEEYYGFGLNASSYLNKMRMKNESRLKNYKNLLLKDEVPVTERDYINLDKERFEYIIMQMRLSKGLSLKSYEKKFNQDFLQANKNIIKDFHKDNLIKIKDNYIFFTKKGFLLSNYFFVHLD